MTEYPKLVEVCSLWQSLIHDFVGMAVRVGEPEPVDPWLGIMGVAAPTQGYQLVPPARINEIGVCDLKISELRNAVLSPLAHPHLLSQLSIERHCSLKNFTRLLVGQNLPNLRKLTISQSTMTELETAPVPLKLPSLRKLCICGPKGYVRHRESIQGIITAPLLLSNVGSLLAKEFENIQILKLQIPAVVHKDVHLMLSILEFLGKSKGTLKVCTYCYTSFQCEIHKLKLTDVVSDLALSDRPNLN